MWSSSRVSSGVVYCQTLIVFGGIPTCQGGVRVLTDGSTHHFVCMMIPSLMFPFRKCLHDPMLPDFRLWMFVITGIGQVPSHSSSWPCRRTCCVMGIHSGCMINLMGGHCGELILVMAIVQLRIPWRWTSSFVFEWRFDCIHQCVMKLLTENIPHSRKRSGELHVCDEI